MLRFSGIFLALAVSSAYCSSSEEADDSVIYAMRDAVEMNQKVLSSGIRPQSDVKCYPRIGCFEKFVNFSPESPEELKTTYSFNTLKRQINVTWNDEKLDTLAPIFSQDLAGKKVRLIVLSHGFVGSANKGWMVSLKDALLKRFGENAVVMMINWKNGAAGPNYAQAAANVDVVARLAALTVINLMKKYPESVEAANIHFVGFSLGGQMSGYFARFFRHETNQKIGRITALDTAAPLFEDYGIYPKREDAHFVEGIHTSIGDNLVTGKVGVKQNYGHIDYYPNGGSDQPGCSLFNVACCHERAYKYLISALNNGCRYTSYLCDNLKNALNEKCFYEVVNPYIGATEASPLIKHEDHSIIIGVKTEDSKPYCKK